jgi:hypothetical protein
MLRQVAVAAFRKLPEEIQVSVRHRLAHGTWPRLWEPQTFSEKIQSRKLYDVDPRLTQLSDKVLVKDYVREKVGDEILIPTLYAGPTLPPVEQRNWPLPFVIKANHGSGMNIFVRSAPDWPEIEAQIAGFMRIDFGKIKADRYYSRIHRQILVEPFIGRDGELPIDYKVFVFGRKAMYVQVDTGRETEHRRVFYDRDWNRQSWNLEFADEPSDIPRPARLADLLSIAETLSEDFNFLRVDFYEIDGQLKFGEITLAPESGFGSFRPPHMNADLGRLWHMNPCYGGMFD